MTNTQYALLLLRRGLRQRCPVCGRGKIFKGWIKTYERCSVCNFAFEREPGYYTGAVAVNLVVSELLITVIAVPLAASQSCFIDGSDCVGVYASFPPATAFLPSHQKPLDEL